MDLILLLDSRKNVNLFNNSNILTNIITDLTKSKNIQGALAHLRHSIIGKLAPELHCIPLDINADYYYSPEVLANILFLGLLSELFWVFMDSSINNAF